MILGGAGIMLANIPLMLAAVFAMGVHSTFFGPIKYAILPQHLRQRRSARRHRPGRGRHLYRDPRRNDPRRRARSRRRKIAAAATIGIAVARLSRRPPGAACAACRGAAADHLAHRPRLDRAGQRDDAHPPAVPRHPRDQLLLDDRRGADHHLPAAGEERARRRTSRSRACSSPSSRSASRSARWRSTACSRARSRRGSHRRR